MDIRNIPYALEEVPLFPITGESGFFSPFTGFLTAFTVQFSGGEQSEAEYVGIDQ